MALPSVRWPLPKASVEYTWVQLGKVLRSALKSRGSPAQQMCGMVGGDGGGGWGVSQKGNSLNEKKEMELLWIIFSGRRRAELPFPPLALRWRRLLAPARSSPLVHARSPACWCRACVRARMYAWAAAPAHWRFLRKSFCECQSIFAPPEVLDSCQATVAVGSAIHRATVEQTRPPVLCLR